jgi:F-type H+-transporting ATPase subunit b
MTISKWGFRASLCAAMVGFVLVWHAVAVAADARSSSGEQPTEREHAVGTAHSGDSTPITGELSFWTLIMFGVLLAVLGRYAWGPLLDALDARERHIRDSLQEAERARDEARRLLAEHERKLADVQNEVRAILDEARRDAQHTQQEILKQAQAEAQATRERAKRDIEQARDHALQELFHRAADLATELASRILRRNLNLQDHRDLIQQVLNELPSKN